MGDMFSRSQKKRGHLFEKHSYLFIYLFIFRIFLFPLLLLLSHTYFLFSMDKLFSWVYNLSNISASSNTQVNGQEATRDETSPTHLENMDQAQPPIESQDVNMQSTGPTDNCINLISSDEEDNVIDLTIDDDVAPASRHYPLTTNYVPPSRRYNLSDRNPVFSRRHTLIDDYPLPPRRHTSIDDMFEISGRRNLRRHGMY
jgi:hypothetical protein